MKTLCLTLILAGISASLYPAVSAAKDQNWSYDGANGLAGPKDWGKLPGDEVCTTGKEQTPIDIVTAQAKENAKLPVLDFHYQPAKLNLENNGHSIQMDFAESALPSTVKIGDQTFRLKQFHFHATSETTINGKYFPLELHLVHTDENGKPSVVIAVLVTQGKHKAALDRLFNSFPPKTGEIVMDDRIQVDPHALLPKNLSYYKFAGSLTTPPCKEGLTWYVLANPIELDAKQIRSFTEIPGFNHTHRPIQPLGSRAIEKLTVSH